MKSSWSVRDLHAELEKDAKLLEEHISERLDDYCKECCFGYHRRIKKVESFAEKIELGRRDIEDFFAATIVVPKYDQIKDVNKFLESEYQLLYKKPEPKAWFEPHNFNFDSHRYYYKLKPTASNAKFPFKDFIFEIQILTMLERAWSTIFHEYSYKSNDIEWAKERLSFQVKTLLKNADLIIHESDKLSGSDFLKENSGNYQDLLNIKEFLLDYWAEKDLSPNNIKRQCGAIRELLKFLEITLEDLNVIIKSETGKGKGAKTVNLSPYSAIIQAFFDINDANFMKKIKQNPSKKTKWYKILLVDEIELPDGFDIKICPSLESISSLKEKAYRR